MLRVTLISSKHNVMSTTLGHAQTAFSPLDVLVLMDVDRRLEEVRRREALDSPMSKRTSTIVVRFISVSRMTEKRNSQRYKTGV